MQYLNIVINHIYIITSLNVCVCVLTAKRTSTIIIKVIVPSYIILYTIRCASEITKTYRMNSSLNKHNFFTHLRAHQNNSRTYSRCLFFNESLLYSAIFKQLFMQFIATLQKKKQARILN